MADDVLGTEAAILDAALEELRAHGVRRTTISDIARRSGLSRQTIYRYWPDAQSLFAALVTRELLAVLPGEADHPRTLEEFVAQHVDTADLIRRMPLLDRLRESDPDLLARYMLERLGTSQRAIQALLAGRVARAQRSGFVRAGDPERIAAMLLLITQSAVQSAPLVVEWLPAQAWRDELAAVVAGYLAGACA